MRLRADGYEQIAGRSAIRRGLSLASQANRLAILNSGRNLNRDRLTLVVRPYQSQIHLTAHHGRSKRHFYLVANICAGLCRASFSTPARAWAATKLITASAKLKS